MKSFKDCLAYVLMSSYANEWLVKMCCVKKKQKKMYLLFLFFIFLLGQNGVEYLNEYVANGVLKIFNI